MKKTILITLAILLVAVLTSASHPVPLQRLQGTLLWERNNICGLPDYVPLPVMENVYLVGNGFPTSGQFQGYGIDAWGTFGKIDGCRVFLVSTYTLRPPAITSLKSPATDSP
jgi:hypothetical protein